jgi:hypothetical protein
MQETTLVRDISLHVLETKVKEGNSQGWAVSGAPFHDRDRGEWCWAMTREATAQPEILRGVDRKRK